MPTSSRSKTFPIFVTFRQIRNISKRADVGIGPYEVVFRYVKSPPVETGGLSYLLGRG